MTSVYISYSNEDFEWEHHIRHWLEAFGKDMEVDIWDDRLLQEKPEHRRAVGVNTLREAIGKATFVVCLLSGHYVGSRPKAGEEISFVQRRAARDRRFLIPVLLNASWDSRGFPWLQGEHIVTVHGKPVLETLNEIGSTVFPDVARAILDEVGERAASSRSAHVSRTKLEGHPRSAGGSSDERHGEAPMSDPNYQAYLRDHDRLVEEHGSCVAAYADGALVAVAKDAKTLLQELPAHYKNKSLLVKDIPDKPVRLHRPRKFPAGE